MIEYENIEIDIIQFTLEEIMTEDAVTHSGNDPMYGEESDEWDNE